jgi:NO-binding membrane sensor protein with MHYT domain
MASLLHGQLMQAMHYNPLFTALLPVLVAFAVMLYWKAVVRNELEWPQLPMPAIKVFLGVAAMFTIARNL